MLSDKYQKLTYGIKLINYPMITNKLQLYEVAQNLQDKKHKLCLQHNKTDV